MSMDLAKLLGEERIIPEMRSSSNQEAIKELINHLCENNFLPLEKKSETIRDLIIREDKTTTGIGSGVAIPHVNSDAVDSTLMIFGRSLEGIDFESIDNNPVNFVILFLIPTCNDNKHLQTLATIARFFTKGNIRERLPNATSNTDILKVIETHNN